MLVVSQAVLSCGFSASSPELSCLYAVIHLGLAAPTCPAFLGMLPVVCLQKVAHRVTFLSVYCQTWIRLPWGECPQFFRQLSSFSLCSNSLAFRLISFPLCH